MKNKKTMVIAISIAATICIITGALFGTHVICIHQWEEATCVTPETCRSCGKIRAPALGHLVTNWETDIEPTCSEEGLKRGKCERCWTALTEPIAKFAHTDGEWIIEKEPVINGDATVTPGSKALHCAICDEIIQTKEYTIELTREQAAALKKTRDIVGTIHFGPGFLIQMLTQCEGFDLEDAKFALEHCDVDWDEQCIIKCNILINEGSSDRKIVEDLQFYGFTDSQINNALEKTGLHK